MKLISILRPIKAQRDHYAQLRGRPEAEQEAEINENLTPRKNAPREVQLYAPRYSLSLEHIAQIGLNHNYRFIETICPARDVPVHNFELIDERIVQRDEKVRALSHAKQRGNAMVCLEGRSYLNTLLIDTNRFTLGTDELDRLARARGYRYSHTTPPVKGCSWHVFERVETA